MGKRKAQESAAAVSANAASGSEKKKKATTSPKFVSPGSEKSPKATKTVVQKIKTGSTPPAAVNKKPLPSSKSPKEHDKKSNVLPSATPTASPNKKKIHDDLSSSPNRSIPSPIQSPSSSPSKKSSFLNSIEEPSTNQVEVFVHRFRAPNCIPRAILRLSATPYMPGLLSYVAISREGGAVELMSVDEHAKCVGIVEGLKHRHVDALAWVCGSDIKEMNQTQLVEPSTAFLTSRRLFGASRDGTIFEIDFYTKSICNVIGSGGGAVFCLTSLCPCCESKDGNSRGGAVCQRFIAAGCEDGSIRIYQAGIKDDNTVGNNKSLNLVKIIPSAGAAVLSLAWLKSPSGDGGIVGSTLYAGLADGTIRKFESSSNVKSSRIIGAGVAEEVVQDQGAWITKDYSTSVQWTSTLRITVENRGRSVPTKIWALKALNDHTVISGDSLGHVQFWDGILGTLIQSFEHSKTDVLDLAVSQDQTKVMACGIDPTIICIGRDSEDSAAPGRVCKRVITGVMRRHSHDVHSLVTVFQTDPSGCAGISTTSNGRGKEIRELLYSGGADTKICSYFVGDIRKYRPRIVYKYPPVQNISLARIPRVFTIMRSDRIDFYKLADKSMKPKKMTHSKVMNDMNSSIGSVVFSSIHNLACCDISDDGSILAVGNAAGLALFSMDYPLEGGVVSKPVKICDPMNFSCTAIKHIPGLNRRFACCTNQGDIRIIKIDVAKDDSTGTQLEAHQESFIVDDKYRESCWSHLALSADGRWLAVANYTTGSGIINIYSLVKGCKHWWTLPLTETPISCMKFLGGNKTCPVLFVGCNNYAFYIYDVERQSLSDFSQDLGFPVSPLLPIELNHRMECPHYVTQNPSKINQFLMGGSGSFCAVDLDSPIPAHCSAFPSNHIIAKRLRNQNSTDANTSAIIQGEKCRNNFTLCLKYSGILFMDFIDEDELLIVEQPWMDILNALPDVLQRKRYGE